MIPKASGGTILATFIFSAATLWASMRLASRCGAALSALLLAVAASGCIASGDGIVLTDAGEGPAPEAAEPQTREATERVVVVDTPAGRMGAGPMVQVEYPALLAASNWIEWRIDSLPQAGQYGVVVKKDGLEVERIHFPLIGGHAVIKYDVREPGRYSYDLSLPDGVGTARADVRVVWTV